MSEQKSGRWWENYAVRYFVGTVFGAAIVIFLNEYPTSPFHCMLSQVAEVKEATFKDITVFASIGFAFCYVASAPILTLHALREHIRLTHVKESYLRWLIALVLAAVSTWLVASFGLGGISALPLTVAGTLVTIIAVQLVLLITAFLNRFALIKRFYVGLSAARASETKQAEEYVESYRHLREHGNAFSILLLEAMLGFVLSNMPTPGSALIVLFVWILPASSSWIIGTALETKFANEPLLATPTSNSTIKP